MQCRSWRQSSWRTIKIWTYWFLTWLIFLLLDKQHGALAAWGLIRSAHIAVDGWPQNQLGGTVAACNQNHVCLTNKNWVTDFIGNPESCTQMLNIFKCARTFGRQTIFKFHKLSIIFEWNLNLTCPCKSLLKDAQGSERCNTLMPSPGRSD